MTNARLLKLSKWKIAAFSLAVLLGIAAIGVYRFLNPADPLDEDPDNSSYNLTKTVISAGMRDMDKASLSPDGSTVLIDRRETKQDLSETRWLEFHDVASFRTLATIPLRTLLPALPPTVPKTQFVSKAVHFCDGGKSILVYESGYTFSIIDTRTYTKKAAITFTATIDRSAETPLYADNSAGILAGGCAANAPVAAVEVAFGPFGTGVTKVFDLDTGNQISEIAADVFGYPINIDVSPSGASAAILVARFQRGDLKPPYDTTKYNADLAILDLNAHSLRRRIRSGMDGSCVTFMGEDEVAVAGSGERDARQETNGQTQEKARIQASDIQLFDIHTGTVSQRFGDPADGARAFVAASSDGRLLLGYTGKEWIYGESTGSYLQIDRARFTIWDRQTGKVMAQSPGLQVFTTDYKMLDNSHTISWRPTMDYSQQGNAVLVSWPGFWTKRLELFTRK
jgi:hypothetical protein